MNPQEFKALVAKIGQNLDNQGLVTELLTQVTDSYESQFNSTENLTKQVGEYETKVQDLQKTNMNLFLKVAQPVPTEDLGKAEPMTYENLLKDMGAE